MALKASALPHELEAKEEKVTKLIKEHAEQALQLDDSAMVEALALKEEVEHLKEEVEHLNEKVEHLKEELEEVERENVKLKDKVDLLVKNVSKLKVVEKVLLRKLCEAARLKCVHIAEEEGVEIPKTDDGVVVWNSLLTNRRLVTLLADKGLTTGLSDVKVIPWTLHAAAYDALESQETFVQTVLELYHNEFRARMENILVFVYPTAKADIADDFDDLLSRQFCFRAPHLELERQVENG